MQQQPKLPPNQQALTQKQVQQQIPPYLLNSGLQTTGPDGKPMPFLIQAKDCVDESQLHANIAANIKLIDKSVAKCAMDKRKVVIVSAGPSAEKYIDLVKEEQSRGSITVCVKHSLPTLMKHGVIPDSCVILDPRPLDGVSTHNVVRKDLYAKFDKQKTKFMIASMTHPSVTRYLLKEGADVFKWDAEVSAIREHFKYQVPFSIIGGSCSAIRAFPLYRMMGFSDFMLLGFDCCFYEDSLPDITAKLADGRPKYMKVTVEGKEFVSTGELCALYQDVVNLLKFPMLDAKLDIVGDGMVKEWFSKNYKQPPVYEDMLKNAPIFERY